MHAIDDNLINPNFSPFNLNAESNKRLWRKEIFALIENVRYITLSLYEIGWTITFSNGK